MGDVVTAENLPQILGAILTINTVYILRDVLKNWRWWRKGVTVKEKDAIAYTVAQLEACHIELAETQRERDHCFRQVGRRDRVILSHGLRVPKDERDALYEPPTS
jgi:hypothetical protein